MSCALLLLKLDGPHLLAASHLTLSVTSPSQYTHDLLAQIVGLTRGGTHEQRPATASNLSINPHAPGLSTH
jgi:hypothetical protein